MTFAEILSEYEIETAPEGHHHSREGWVQFDCPKCGKDSHKFHMGYSISNGFCNCWSCGYANVVEVLVELTGLPYYKVKELLKDVRVGYTPQARPTGKLTIPKGVKSLDELKQHRKYLRGRGYNWKKIVKIWGVQGIGFEKDFAWRLFIPIHHHGEIVSWTTRTISSNPHITRYLSASPKQEAMNHKELLYGEDYARHAIVICEGPFDAWRIGPGAVATLGVGYSEGQINRILRFPIRAICFDAQTAAQKRAKKLRDQLTGFKGETYVIELESGKDAGEASEGEILQIRKEILK